MLEYVAIIFIGVAAGVFTGVVPGIHPNTVIFMSLPFYLSSGIELLFYMVFITSLSVSHTFHDFLPAIFLSAPEPEAALSSLPGTEMASKGEGLEAFSYTLGGGVYSVLSMIVFAPLLFVLLPSIYSYIEPVMEYILLFFLLVLIFEADETVSAAIVAGLSAMLGLIAFEMPVNQNYVLVPVFAGLFAVPAVVRTFQNDFQLPPQRKKKAWKDSKRGGFLGFIAGLVAGVFPGLGAAVSTSFLAPFMNESRKEFLAGMGGVNTSDILMSFLALFLIGKARSGASVALQSISSIKPPQLFFLVGSALLSVSVAALVASITAPEFVVLVRNFDFDKVLVLVVIVLAGTSFLLTGFQGLLVMLTASLIGYAGVLSDDRRVLMSVLIVPAILFFSGINFI